MSDILTVQETSLTSIADSIRKKTGKKDKLAFPSGFVSEIDSIQTGGGSAPAEEVEEKDVNFFDYDGTLIASYTEAEAKALTTLPTPPEHSGLVFQGWNYTLEEVIANAEMADIGALYTTDDGATRIKIVIASENVLDFRLRYRQSGSGSTISWGDGETDTQTVSDVDVRHTYKAPGAYIIKITPNSDCVLRFDRQIADDTSSTLRACEVLEVNVGSNVTALNAAFKRFYALKRVSLPVTIQTIGNEVFYPSGIRHVTIPAGVSSIGGAAFRNCTALSSVSIPVSVSEIQSNAFYNCQALERVVMKHVSNPGDYLFFNSTNIKRLIFNSEVTYIGSSICKQCSSLVDVKFLGNVKMFYSGAFSSCYSLGTIDLTNCQAVPNLQDSTVFSGMGATCRILVPASLVDEWKTETNWATYKNRILGV